MSKKDFIGEYRAGFALAWRRFELSYTHVWRVREFDLQTLRHVFGSLTPSVEV